MKKKVLKIKNKLQLFYHSFESINNIFLEGLIIFYVKLAENNKSIFYKVVLKNLFVFNINFK